MAYCGIYSATMQVTERRLVKLAIDTHGVLILSPRL